MEQDYDSSISGYVTDSFEGLGRHFTDVEVVNSSEVNIVAKAKRYGRWWLLKGLAQKVAHEKGYQQRLRKELEILMTLQHPYIVATYGIEEVEELGTCIVMEYVEGTTLKEWLKGKTTGDNRKRIARELTEAVGYIHSKGIAHRDLKPQNIIITRNGENVKLIDFGLADTDSHSVLKQPAGTPSYMSPEQAATMVADVRNDIYSMGVIFEQMGVGYLRIIKRCRRPIEERYQNIEEMKADMLAEDKKGQHITIASVAIIITLLTCMVAWQTMKINEFETSESTSTAERILLKKDMKELTDSLENITEEHAKIKAKQELADAKKKRVKEAIEIGNMRIDAAMRATGIWQHMDTLTSTAYMKYYPDGSQGKEALEKYIKSIEGKFSEDEMREIRIALKEHRDRWLAEWTEKFKILDRKTKQEINNRLK